MYPDNGFFRLPGDIFITSRLDDAKAITKEENQ
jgi:hypothetical protein